MFNFLCCFQKRYQFSISCCSTKVMSNLTFVFIFFNFQFLFFLCMCFHFYFYNAFWKQNNPKLTLNEFQNFLNIKKVTCKATFCRRKEFRFSFAFAFVRVISLACRISCFHFYFYFSFRFTLFRFCVCYQMNFRSTFLIPIMFSISVFKIVRSCLIDNTFYTTT